MSDSRRLPWDWHDGLVPESAVLHGESMVESSYQFMLDRSEPGYGVRVHRGATTYGGTMFDLGPNGRLEFGAFAITNGTRFVCDELIEVGEYAMLAWNAIIMDTRRAPLDPAARAELVERVPHSNPRRLLAAVETAPVRIGRNTWIGFDAVIMPGVTVGDGSIVGHHAVVWDDVEPNTIVIGNPARPVKRLEAERAAIVQTPDGPRTYAALLSR